jgi:hypothetical protein
MTQEDALKLEIQFWKDLLNKQGSGTPAEIIERMMMAISLAERKLSAFAGPVGLSIH